VFAVSYSTNSWQYLGKAGKRFAGMAKRIDQAQFDLAQKMRAAGESWSAIAKATKASERALRYNAAQNGWQAKGSKKAQLTAGKAIAKSGNAIATIGERSIVELAELVKNSLAVDIEASVEALASWQPSELELGQLEKRERVADSVQKRAASLFDIGQPEQAVVNIAVLSQLPESITH
tara:strand:- start:165 stop:698 length:534 start_codon:yes stop_codon:yes gene_type:complete